MTTLYSIGHGSRDIEVFVARLREAGVEQLADVRAVPRSRRHPQFGYGPLGARLAAEGLRYAWHGRALGGMRRASQLARHGGLREPAFRAYAEHMEGASFRAGIDALLGEAAQAPLCLMCAERDPVHCHRSLIADWLVVHGHRVIHLLDAEAREHTLHPSAKVEAGVLHYPLESAQGSLF